MEEWCNSFVFPQVNFDEMIAESKRIADGHRMIHSAVDLMNAEKQASEKLEKINADIDRAEKDYLDKLHEFGVCPFCGSSSFEARIKK